MAKQLEMELVHNKLIFSNKNSESRIRIEVKELLHFKEFDLKSDNRVILPNRSRLMKYVYAQYGKKQINVFEKFTARITKQQREFFKKIYKDSSSLNEIRKPIGEVNIKNVTTKIEIIENFIELRTGSTALENDTS